jgi:DNA-binding NarL/FixJ family response regulator
MPQQKGILLIGDEAGFKEFIKVAATIAPDIPCYWADDVMMARGLLASKPVQVIFLDLYLKHGWEFLSKLKERYREIPVVACGRIGQPEWERARELGAKAYCPGDIFRGSSKDVIDAIAERIQQGTLGSMTGLVYM